MERAPKPRTVLTKQARIAELAKKMPETALFSLSYHIDLDWMREAHRCTNKRGAAGIDGLTAADIEDDLDTHLQGLIDGLKSMTYRAPPVRRVMIPKDGGKERPIGIPTLLDKVLQRAVKMALEPLYEQDFYSFSYGFRPGRSAHDAHQALDEALFTSGSPCWVLDVDVRSFFDTIDHQALRDLLKLRVADGPLIRAVGKWLRAGVMEGGVVHHPDRGTPQGGVISPLLANIYLHHVLDHWWVTEVLPRLHGKVHLIRYADDFVMVFERRPDARRLLSLLPKRFKRFGLTLHPEKTRLLRFKPPRNGMPGKGDHFDFLGLTFFPKRSKRGRWFPASKTAAKSITRFLRKVREWLRQNRHLPVPAQHAALSRRLRGHFNYFARNRWNHKTCWHVRYAVSQAWFKWLNRRSHRSRMTWERFNETIWDRHPLPKPVARERDRQLAFANL